MYLVTTNDKNEQIHLPLFKLLDELMIDRAHQVGTIDLAFVGELAILWAGDRPVNTVTQIQVAYSNPRPLPNHPWLHTIRTKWLPRHMSTKDVSYVDNGKSYLTTMPYLKLARMRKLYQTPPISHEHYAHLTQIELLLEERRQLALRSRE